MNRHGIGKFWVVVICLALVFVSLFEIGAYLKGRKLAPFRPFLYEYMVSVDAKRDKLVSITGKMIVVNVKDREFDDLFFQLPNNVAAGTPDEVGVVAQLAWGREQTCTYGNDTGGTNPGYSQTCHVTLV